MSASKLASLAAAAALIAPAAAFATTNYEVDSAHTAVNFSIRHMMVTNVRGSFGGVTGTVNIDDKKPANSKIDVEIDVTSIYTGVKDRDDHLRSADFFDVEKFPKATFKSTKVTRAGKGKFKVEGKLTLKGVTKPVTLDLESAETEYVNPWGKTVRGASATAKLKREDFGLTWNKALETGGLLVGSDVTLNIEAELVRKEAAASKE